MANHVAEQIIAAAVSALGSLNTTGSNAFASREYPLQDSELPAILIDHGNEELESVGLGASRVIERTLELVVIAKVKKTSGALARTDLNTIRKEVESALASDNTLGGTCKYVNPRRYEMELDEEGEKSRASGTMFFEVFYATALNAPDVPL